MSDANNFCFLLGGKTFFIIKEKYYVEGGTRGTEKPYTKSFYYLPPCKGYNVIKVQMYSHKYLVTSAVENCSPSHKILVFPLKSHNKVTFRVKLPLN